MLVPGVLHLRPGMGAICGRGCLVPPWCLATSRTLQGPCGAQVARPVPRSSDLTVQKGAGTILGEEVETGGTGPEEGHWPLARP